jgi:hypothetical protein
MAKDNNTLLIVAGVAVVGLVAYALMNKNNAQTVVSNAGSTGNSGTNYNASSAQNISAFGSLFSGAGQAFASVYNAFASNNKPASNAIAGTGSTPNTA